jgi:hypothetical protein
MSIKLYIILCFLSIHLTFFTQNLFGQEVNKYYVFTKNEDQLYAALDSIILTRYYETTDSNLNMVFTFKIDSLGEVHSAHIRLSKNLKHSEYFTICNQIEWKFRMKFFFELFKNEDRLGNYVSCNFVFRKPRFK